MERVTHREMRNRSGEILRRAASGETIEVTNNGHAVAHIGPPTRTTIEELIERGEVRLPTGDVKDLAKLERVKLPISTEELIDDSRGRW